MANHMYAAEVCMPGWKPDLQAAIRKAVLRHTDNETGDELYPVLDFWGFRPKHDKIQQIPLYIRFFEVDEHEQKLIISLGIKPWTYYEMVYLLSDGEHAHERQGKSFEINVGDPHNWYLFGYCLYNSTFQHVFALRYDRRTVLETGPISTLASDPDDFAEVIALLEYEDF